MMDFLHNGAVLRKGQFCSLCRVHEAAWFGRGGSIWHVSAFPAEIFAGCSLSRKDLAAVLQYSRITNSWGQNNDLFLISYRAPIQRSMADVIFSKHRLSCKCRWHRFEVLCWSLCCRRLLPNVRANFIKCWNNFLFSLVLLLKTSPFFPV